MEEENKKINVEKAVSNEAVKRDAKSLFLNIKIFLSELLDIRSDTDRDSTIEAVKKDISFKGHNAWILIFSIFVASIGLNVSSTAVVIGAMLISPLMGPIVGIGLSLAINDIEMLRRSLINLAVMIVLSVLTATLYFLITPITELTPELEARTYPTILDVLVAIFGGLALIVGKTKKGTMASVLFGVAIATALMPPLCTVGYGIAMGEPSYYTGAFYLFSINAVFIALSTFLVSKLLGFPMVKYANSKRRRFIAQMASLVALIVMIPSMFLFYNLYKTQVFNSATEEYVKTVIKYEGAEVVKKSQDYKTKRLDVYLIGNLVPKQKIAEWYKDIRENENLKEVDLKIHQGADQSSEMAEQLSSAVKSGILEDLYVNNQQALTDKNSQIQLLENEITRLRSSGIPFKGLSEEVHINYENIDRFGFSNTINTDFKKADTIPVFFVKWNSKLSGIERKKEEAKLKNWIKLKYNLDTLDISNY